MIKCRYLTCHRYDIDISINTISKAPIRYDTIDIGDVSWYFRYENLYSPHNSDSSSDKINTKLYNKNI